MIPQFNNIGSDPEFLFTRREEFRTILVPANTLITEPKPVALRAFVGTDNHAATAEIRPSPTHNIGRHLYEIAYGLHETDKWLAASKKFNDVKMVAQPHVTDEPLGGHIHCSFFVDEPETLQLNRCNRMFLGDRLVPLDPAALVPPLQEEDSVWINEYVRKFKSDQVMHPLRFAEYMDYLLWPYECAIQPWWDRLRRNSRYGGTSGVGDRVRRNFSTPKSNKTNKFAYFHYEYRAPSTWLCHPWLAYAYLGLTKLSILNTTLLHDSNKTFLLPEQVPQNKSYQKLFTERFQLMIDKGRWTTDLKALQQIIPKTFMQRSAWFEIPGQPIDIDAWRRLL